MFFTKHYELASHLVDVDINDEEKKECEIEELVEEKLYEKYDLWGDSFDRIIDDLLPLCNKGMSILSGKTLKGFLKEEGDLGFWLSKLEYKDKGPKLVELPQSKLDSFILNNTKTGVYELIEEFIFEAEEGTFKYNKGDIIKVHQVDVDNNQIWLHPVGSKVFSFDPDVMLSLKFLND